MNYRERKDCHELQIKSLVPDGIQRPGFHGRVLPFLSVARNPNGAIRIAET